MCEITNKNRRNTHGLFSTVMLRKKNATQAINIFRDEEEFLGF